MSGRGIFLKTTGGIMAVLLFTIMLAFHGVSVTQQAPPLQEIPDYIDTLGRFGESDETIKDDHSSHISAQSDRVWSLSPICQKNNIHTFFTELEHDFSKLQQEEEATPTLDFLQSAQDLSAIFDRLSSVAFGAVKSDYLGNIENIKRVYRSSTSKSRTLQEMVVEEVNAGSEQTSGGAAQSILWLTRSVYFLGTVLDQMQTQTSFVDAASFAYDTVLRKHHSWLLRPLVSAALRAAPSTADALNAFALTEDDKSNPQYVPCTYESAKAFNDQLLTTCRNIDRFFKSKNLPILD